MAMNLEQYADFLDTRKLPWPAPPPIEKVRARPSVQKLDGIRVVLWNVYGTLLSIPPEGDLLFEHPNDYVMEAALEKTIAEFKMWGSMSRKPGQPSEYMKKVYHDIMDQLRMAPNMNEKHPEMEADKIWDAIVKRLLQKDYKFDAGMYGGAE